MKTTEILLLAGAGLGFAYLMRNGKSDENEEAGGDSSNIPGLDQMTNLIGNLADKVKAGTGSAGPIFNIGSTPGTGPAAPAQDNSIIAGLFSLLGQVINGTAQAGKDAAAGAVEVITAPETAAARANAEQAFWRKQAQLEAYEAQLATTKAIDLKAATNDYINEYNKDVAAGANLRFEETQKAVGARLPGFLGDWQQSLFKWAGDTWGYKGEIGTDTDSYGGQTSQGAIGAGYDQSSLADAERELRELLASYEDEK